MLHILDDMKDHNDLRPNEEKCFRRVLENEQIAVFSTPSDEGPLDESESHENKIATKNSELHKELAVQVKHGDQNIGKLLAYLLRQINRLQ